MHPKIEKYITYTALIGLVIGLATFDAEFSILDAIGLALFYFSKYTPGYLNWIMKWLGLILMVIVTIIIFALLVLVIIGISAVF